MPDFRFTLEMWAQVSFPIVKLLSMAMPSPTESKRSAFTWICLGVDGEVAVFRGQERVNHWDSTKGALDQDQELGFPVDMVVFSGDDDPERQTAAVVFPDRIRVFSIDPATQK
ncbi:hypothetical protein BBJ28_00022969 [Nothophytophthora sp. Chile5]|nr:hypothetical protein BBJ28_00022969 [Nothophytophthora sp. Chile5]